MLGFGGCGFRGWGGVRCGILRPEVRNMFLNLGPDASRPKWVAAKVGQGSGRSWPKYAFLGDGEGGGGRGEEGGEKGGSKCLQTLKTEQRTI